MYVPSFLLIHRKPTATEGPAVTLSQRDLLLAYREVDVELADIALKYFREHALQWMTPTNVAVSVFAEWPPYPVEAVKTGRFPDYVDAQKPL